MRGRQFLDRKLRCGTDGVGTMYRESNGLQQPTARHKPGTTATLDAVSEQYALPQCPAPEEGGQTRVAPSRERSPEPTAHREDEGVSCSGRLGSVPGLVQGSPEVAPHRPIWLQVAVDTVASRARVDSDVRPFPLAKRYAPLRALPLVGLLLWLQASCTVRVPRYILRNVGEAHAPRCWAPVP
jgi:hypothetical protein